MASLLMALLLPGCRDASFQSNETAAIGRLRAVVSAQATHAVMCDGSYAPTFETLIEAGYLSCDFGAGEQPANGAYRFRMTAVKGEGVSSCGDMYTAYELVADPARPGETGQRFFRARNDELQEATSSEWTDAKPLQ